jgi:GNAT superfamily N-acetyltransferase
MSIQIIDISDDRGVVSAPEWLARAYPVHRQLRVQLVSLEYEAKMRRVFATGGRMCVATEGDGVVGVIVYRIQENTFDGRLLYIDDLVSDEEQRSNGVGRMLLAHVERKARAQGCRMMGLDSGVQRARAHKFYFREGFTISSFRFRKPLT